MSGIGVYLAAYDTGTNGITSDSGNISIRAINNTATWWAAYIRQSITASSGSVTISAAGKYGLALDNFQSVVSASGDINLISYASLYSAIYLNTGVTNTLQSSAGSINFSAYTTDTTTSY